MEKELFDLHKKLFAKIICDNGYYTSIKKEYKQNADLITKIVNDYIEREHISIYDYLDTIQDYMAEHKEDVCGAIEMLDNFGGWYY